MRALETFVQSDLRVSLARFSVECVRLDSGLQQVSAFVMPVDGVGGGDEAKP